MYSIARQLLTKCVCSQSGRKGVLVGAKTQILGDSVEDITVAGGLLPDVQLQHAQPKALHLQCDNIAS